MVHSLVSFRAGLNLGAMLNAINPDEGLGVIYPVQNPVITDAQLAEAGQFFGHSDEATMHHDACVFRQPLEFPLDTGADDAIQLGQLCRPQYGSHKKPGEHAQVQFLRNGVNQADDWAGPTPVSARTQADLQLRACRQPKTQPSPAAVRP